MVRAILKALPRRNRAVTILLRAVLGTIIAVVVACAGLFLIIQWSNANPSRIKPGNDPRERLLRDFDLIAFNWERTDHWWLGRRRARVYKWADDISLYLDGYRDERVRLVVQEHIDLLSEITRLKFRIVDKETNANVRVLFIYPDEMVAIARRLGMSEREIADLFTKASCNGQITQTRENPSRYVSARIFIHPESRIASLQRCVSEELTQMLGLTNDSDEVVPSIFNNQSQLEDLTAKDRFLLRLLYDPQLKIGMDREEALRIARRIIGQSLSEAQAVQLHKSP